MTGPLAPPDRLRAALSAQAGAALDDMLDRVAANPSHIGRIFPAAARRTARGDIGLLDDAGRSILAEDVVRVELFLAAISSMAPDARQHEVAALYRFGDNDEKRAVLLGLGAAGDLVDGTDVLQDALRTNDTRLVRAAMGPQAEVLDDETWRQGVLKCLFVGVALSEVADLDLRTDGELADMVARYAHERVAAGRDVPADVWLVLDRHPASVSLIDLDAELEGEHEDRRQAARRLLDGRPTTNQEHRR